jgi:hypothetical protein
MYRRITAGAAVTLAALSLTVHPAAAVECSPHDLALQEMTLGQYLNRLDFATVSVHQTPRVDGLSLQQCVARLGMAPGAE